MLEVVLAVNALLVGALVVFAVQHALAHFRPHEHDAEHHALQQLQNGHLPPALRQQLIEEAQKRFESVVHQSAVELQNDLVNSTARITKQLDTYSDVTLKKELTQYNARIAELQKQTETTITDMNKEITSHQDDLKAKLTENITAEKQRLIQQIDTKLADAVASFLTETLQHNIDLGAQTPYLISMLEEHKDEIAKGVTDESQT